MSKKYLILDCDYLCHRAKYSMGILTYEGKPTETIFGFLKSLPALQDLFDATGLVFCWDFGKNKREEIFPEYKANRKDRYKCMDEDEIEFEKGFRLQMKKLRTEYLGKIGFKNIFWQDGYESDDIIASVCQNLPEGDEAVIVSSDKDLYQLISHNISFYNPQKNKVLTLQGFKKQYGITPHEWKLVKAIAGCSTDSVPGIKGVGEITVIKYLQGRKVRLYERIVSKEGLALFLRNTKLVSLPFKGTKVFKLRKDKLSEQGWKEVCELLGMKSIRDKFSFGRRRR